MLCNLNDETVYNEKAMLLNPSYLHKHHDQQQALPITTFIHTNNFKDNSVSALRLAHRSPGADRPAPGRTDHGSLSGRTALPPFAPLTLLLRDLSGLSRQLAVGFLLVRVHLPPQLRASGRYLLHRHAHPGRLPHVPQEVQERVSGDRTDSVPGLLLGFGTALAEAGFRIALLSRHRSGDSHGTINFELEP